MNRNTGIVGAIVLALAAVVGVFVMPSSKGELPTTGSSQTRDHDAVSKPPLEPISPCKEIGKRIAEFIPDKFVAPPDSCFDPPKPADKSIRLPGAHLPPPAKLTYIIATLPDPVHTHFSLLFDRLTEALQQGAQDQGYNYDGSWLPWNDESRSYDRLEDQQRADELSAAQEKQPGVLVFRKALPPSSDSNPCQGMQNPGKTKQVCADSDPGSLAPYSAGLIVFVVGENPTGGMNLQQFGNAVAWIHSLTSHAAESKLRSSAPQTVEPKIRILGPYFSGSFPSLAEALRARSLVEPNKTITIFSGTVSSKSGIDWFTKFLGDSPDHTFYSFQENDDVMIDRYCQYLTKLGYDTGKLAILSEDETAYGRVQVQDDISALPHCDNPPKTNDAHGPLYLYYPRDIASLRSAYEQHSGARGSSQNQPRDPRLGLPLNLTEPSSRQHDTIRSYGGAETPLSQEATLFGITNLFSSHDIQFIVLRSSNTLDQIFLTRFLSTAYPQARVVLTSADLLFRRSSETAGFRGTMTLTTYPLLTWQQDWTHWQTLESRHSHRAFPEDFAEGLYLATRFLVDGAPRPLEEGNTADHPLQMEYSSVVIQDYAPPSWLLPQDPASPIGTRPPTWLSVIGNEQLWPVAVLDSGVLRGTTSFGPLSTLPWVRSVAQEQPVSLPLQLPMKVLLFLSVLWGVWHFVCCALGSRMPSLGHLGSVRHLANFAPMKRRQQKTLMFVGSLVMVLFAVILLSLTGVLAGANSGYKPIILVGLACLALVGLAIERFVLNCKRRLELSGRRSRLGKGVVRFLFCSIAGITFYDVVGLLVASTVVAITFYFANPIILAGLTCLVLVGLAMGGFVLNCKRRLELSAETRRKSIKRDDHYIKDASRRLRFLTRWSRLSKDVVRFLIAATIVGITFYWATEFQFTAGNAIPVYWRSLNPLNGVSPIMPMLLLMVGLYAWYWFTLSGLALFNDDRPRLPRCLEPGPYPSVLTGKKIKIGYEIEWIAIPLSRHYAKNLLGAMVLLMACGTLVFAGPYLDTGSLLRAFSVRSLGTIWYGRIFLVYLSLCIGLILLDGWRLLRLWGRLRQLLMALDQLPLRRTLRTLKGFSWGTVWNMGGNVLDQRNRLIARQIESLQHLQNQLKDFSCNDPDKEAAVRSLDKPLLDCERSGAEYEKSFAEKLTELAGSQGDSGGDEMDFGQLRKLQTELAATAALVWNRILLVAWPEEKCSLIRDAAPAETQKTDKSKDETGTDKAAPPVSTAPEYVSAAEEFFALPCLGFIQNILGRIRTMTLGMLFLFVATTLSVACYPFDPRPVLSGMFLAVFAVISAIVIFVYAEMHRDATLSHITNTNPGELGTDFWVKLITFGAWPVMGLLTALFPQITTFVTSWLQPGVQAIK
ncbi:MAG: hypothetical protein ACLPND_15375 [Candidatus Korobacteraceae bacterium]